MKKKTIAKMIGFNLLLFLSDVFIFSKTVLNGSVAHNSSLVTSLGITAAAVSLVAFVVVNTRFVTALKEPKPMESIEPPKLENYRATLERFRSSNSKLMDYVHEAIEQMDSISKKQTIMHEILARNNKLSYSNSFMQAQEVTEGIINSNIKNLLNRLSLWDDRESKDPDRSFLYQQHLAYIKDILDKNEAILIKFDLFLAEMAKTDNEIIAEDQNLDAFIKALETINNKSNTMSM